jgi:hypothetical protein
MRQEGSLPRWMLAPTCRLIATHVMRMPACFSLLEQRLRTAATLEGVETHSHEVAA